jgi:peptidoglycan/xylan/chitin deacetylase (PgdA/CDA1 family)
MAARDEFIEYIMGDGSPPFPSLALADIGLPGAIGGESRTIRTQQNSFAIFAGPVGRGWAVTLPFAADVALTDDRAHHKSFYAPFDRLPSELVSTVAKGEVRHIVRDALAFLHARRGIPYAHLWYFPGGARNAFAFRVDSDAAPRRDVDRLYDIARRNDVSLTWFLDVKSHESWLPHFAAMTGQEFGVHCYHHRVSGDRADNAANFGKAKTMMEAVGFSPEGFAAPFGVWNRGMATVIKELGFRYSSEFGYAYDTLPFSPASPTGVYGIPQIPVHPICIGTLRQAGYTDQRMQQYFSMAASWKIARREPLFFYHHPGHQSWETVESILSLAALTGVRAMTLGAFAEWWGKRTSVHPDLRVEKGWLVVDRPSAARMAEADTMVRIVSPEGEEAVVAPGERLDLELLGWEKPPTFSPPADLRKIRDFDPRRMLGDLYNSMMRRMR